MKKILLTLCCSLLTAISYAYDFAVENEGQTFYYTISLSNENTVMLAGGSFSGDVVIPANVEYAGKTFKVINIRENAFINCSSLTTINIPESVNSIGYETFMNCSSLTTINIPESVNSIGISAFSNCM